MTTDKKRPVNLNLISFKFPPMALVSIAHRISGLLLFIFVPFLLWLLGSIHGSAAGFEQTGNFLSSGLMKLLAWVVMLSGIFHVLAGVRHLIMDMGMGEGLCAARASALIVMALFVLSIILTGVWLW
mgnify:CR=1 FL=1